jgi:hypothetical protein
MDRCCEQFDQAPLPRGVRLLMWVWVGFCVVAFSALGIASPPGLSVWFAPLALVAVGLAAAGFWGLVYPRGYGVSPDGLDILWPGRRMDIRTDELVGARRIDREQLGWTWCALLLSLHYRHAGFGGGFGLAWSTRLGFLHMYASRREGLILIERRNARPLLLTPTDPEAFAAAVNAVAAGRAEV